MSASPNSVALAIPHSLCLPVRAVLEQPALVAPDAVGACARPGVHRLAEEPEPAPHLQVLGVLLVLPQLDGDRRGVRRRDGELDDSEIIQAGFATLKWEMLKKAIILLFMLGIQHSLVPFLLPGRDWETMGVTLYTTIILMFLL